MAHETKQTNKTTTTTTTHTQKKHQHKQKQQAFRTRKEGKEMDSPLELLEGTQPC